MCDNSKLISAQAAMQNHLLLQISHAMDAILAVKIELIN